MDPGELSSRELESYLMDLLEEAENLDASRIIIHVLEPRAGSPIVHLTGEVHDDEQRQVAELLVLDVVPEDRLVDDLLLAPEMTEGETGEEEIPLEPPAEIEEEEETVEWDDAEDASQDGKPYEPPVSPQPEPRHEGDW